jgi:peroxiredoxin
MRGGCGGYEGSDMTKRYKGLIYGISIVILAVFLIFAVKEWFIFRDAVSAKNVQKEKAPDFKLKDLQGEKFKLSDQKGKQPVLLIFTTTWCSSCQEKIPRLKDIYGSYSKKGLVMVNIDIQESQDKVSRFAGIYNIPYRVLLDETAEVAKSYGVRGVPTMVLIDRKGMIVCRQCSSVEPLLDKMLK